MTLAVNEACENAIEHAHRFGGLPLHVELRRDDGLVTIAVRDRGRWRQGRSPDRGRGFTLMRALMGSVDVEPGTQGSTVIMRRRLRAGG